MGILIRGKYLLSDAGKGEKGVLQDTAVYVSDGIVKELGTYPSLRQKYPGAKVVGNGKQLVMPGLIDAHTHGRGLSFLQRGVPFDYLENCLIDWAFAVDLEPELSSMLMAVRHIRNGCTTLHHNNMGKALDPGLFKKSSGAIEGYKKAGIRVAYSPGIRNVNTLAYDDVEFFNTLPPELQEFARPLVFIDKQAAVDAFFEYFEKLYDKYNDENTRILMGPNWVQGSTDEYLVRAKQKADELGKLPIHIHTLQTPIQKAFGLRKYGKSLLAHLDDIGLVDSNLVLGHAVFVNQEDIELLASKNASITHHPSCNFAVRNGIAPVYQLHKAGVNVALGIDEKGINDDEDPIMELRMIYYIHRVPGFDLANSSTLNAFDVLEMGTTNAARVCGFEGELGSIKPGMKADIITVDLEEITEAPWISPDLNIMQAFIHRARGSHVNTAVIAGEIVMEDREIKTVDMDLLYQEVRKQASSGISSEQRQYAQNLQKIKPYYHKWYQDWIDYEFEAYYPLNSKK